jgi:hypothetical protein
LSDSQEEMYFKVLITRMLLASCENVYFVVLITQLPSQDSLNSIVLGFPEKVPYVTIQAA